MDSVVSFLNNSYLIAIVVGVFVMSMFSRFARR
jgi:uncharacterized membrane protein